MAIKARYKGSDDPTQDYLNGVPARDLTDAVWDTLDTEQKAAVSASPLYALRGEAKDEGERAERKVEREQRAAERAQPAEVRVAPDKPKGD
jgi:hypothetical protein